MPQVEIIILILLFVVSTILILRDFKLGLYVLLGLSLLLHKEVFSIYRWDVLPVRVFSLALTGVVGLKVIHWFYKTRNLTKVKEFLKQPFVFLILLLWFFRLISILFSKNFTASILLFGFFTTAVAISFSIFYYFQDKNDQVLKILKYYIFLGFILSLIAYVQWFVYDQTEFIFGALWNIPGKIPRLGSLFWDTNHFGAFLMLLLPVLGVFILVEKRLKHKFFYILMFASMASVLLFTSSRTSWIGAFVSFVGFITILLMRRFGNKAILGILIFFVIISIPALIEYSDRSSPFRKTIRDYFHYRMDSFDSHMMLLDGTFQVFELYPVFGGGYGSFYEHFRATEIAPEFFGRDPAALNTRVPAHTIWGELVAETGILGLTTFTLFSVLVLLTLFYSAINREEKDAIDFRKLNKFQDYLTKNQDFLFAAAMGSAITGVFVAGIFYSYNTEFFWIILSLYFVFGYNLVKDRVKLNQIIHYFIAKRNLLFYVVLLLSFGLILVDLGKNHLIPWDEAIYAEISKNMVESDDYKVMTWRNSEPWFEKPPLNMWMMSQTMSFLGYNSWGARLPSAIFGIGTVIVVYLFSKRMFGRSTAFLSSVALLGTFHFTYYSRTAMIDVTATFFITLSLYLYWLAKEQNKLPYWILLGFSTGFAVMSKGVIGFLAFPIIGIYELYLLISRQQKLSLSMIGQYFVSFVSSAFIFVPWHLEMYLTFGNAFFSNYIGYHVIQRATQSIEDKGRPLFWYLVVLRVSMRIWFGALLAAIPLSIYRVFKKDNRHVFLLIWSLFIFVFFSIPTSKLIWYIIPLYPAVAILCGYFADKFIDFFRQKFDMNNYLYKYLAVFFVMVVSLFYLFIEHELVYTSDLTGSQANLLMLKDRRYGEETKVYADRIELPLVLFYSDGPFEIVDFGPLERILYEEDLKNNEVVFITKESRFRSYLEAHPQLDLIRQDEEWVLGHLDTDD